MLRAVVTIFLSLFYLASYSWGSQNIHQKTQTDARPRLGLVLSGGGARGFAHIGVLKALEEMRIPFDVVAGTSMGSMVGGGFAAGYSADEIRDITLSVNWPRMFAPSADREKLSWHRKEEDRQGVGGREIGISAQGLKFPAQFVPSQELDIFLQRVTEPVNSVNDLSELSIPFAALATDLESGARVVLQKGVTLSQAMRASMSVPGAYSPVEYDGRLLVDGGLVDNLPVEQARSMGADVVVVINAGTPLSKRQNLDSVLGIMGQVVNLLTEQNVQASLKKLRQTDVYIAPDLSGFNSGDFMRSKEIIERGYQAAIARKKELEVYSVSEERYRAWQQTRAKEMHRVHSHQLSGVRIDGLKVVNSERVLSDIDINSQGEVGNEEVADAAREIWATGDFQSVPFKFEPGPYNTEVLVFEPKEKDYGYSVLRFGGNLQSNFQESNTFNVILSHSWGWLNSWGASWNNLLQLGEVKRFASQWHQPLGTTSKFFFMPQVRYKWEPFELYDERGNSLARFRNESFDAGLYLGYDMGRFGRIKAGGGWFDTRTKTEISPINMQASAQACYTEISFEVDTLDHASFPTKGLLLDASVWRAVSPDAERMDVIDGVSYDINVWKPFKLGRRTTLLLSGRYARAPQAGNFNIGGVFNLSGSPYGRYAGNRVNLARAMLYHDVSRHVDVFGMPVYLGASFEFGRAHDEGDPSQGWQLDREWKRAGSVYVALDSWLGPLYLVAGRTFGEESSVTLYWGQLH